MNNPKKTGRSFYFILFVLACISFTTANAQYSMVGSASNIGTNTYRLTADTNWQNGSVWKTATINLNTSFDFYFDLYFGLRDGTGADGITFTLQQQGTNAGTAGQGLGVGGVAPSLIVEYDTWNNTPYDIVPDHIAIEKNGDPNHTTPNTLKGPIQANLNSANIEDGLWHSTRVMWNAGTQTMDVYFDCELRLSYTGDIVNTIFGGNPNVYYGFTAATGGSKNEHRIRDLHVLPTVFLKDTICSGSSTKVDLSGADTYLWTPNYAISSTTSPNPTFNPTVTTQYIVTVTNKCETWKDTVLITVNPKPVVNLGPDITLCQNDAAITIDAGNVGSTYKWSTPDNSNETTKTILKSAAGTYSVTVTDVNKCKSSDAMKIKVNPLPVVVIGDQAICAGLSATFDAGVFTSYKWNNNSTLKTLTTSTAGNYWVQVTDANGCKNSDTAVLKVNPSPVVVVADQIICQGQSATFDPGIFASYQWNDNSTLQTFTTSTAGNYSVQVTDANGCKNTDAAALTVNPLPVVSITDQTICGGQSVTFDPGVFTSYLWNDSTTLQKLIATTTGNYWVEVTDANGCKKRDTAAITANPLPVVVIDNQAICQGKSATFDAGNAAIGFTYKWNDNSTLKTLNTSTAGDYWVEVTDVKGCKNSDTANLKVNPLPTVVVADQAICQGQSATFDAGTFASYLWNDNSTLQTLTTSTAGNYSVQVTDTNGCVNSDAAALTINPSPIVKLGNDTLICEGATVLLSSNVVGKNYLWNTNETTSSINVSVSGTYSIDVTNNFSCVGSDEIIISVVPFPVLDLGPDINICKGRPVTIDSKLNTALLKWSTKETTPSITVDGAAQISLIAFFDPACPVYDTVLTTVTAMPVSTLTPDTVLCFLDVSTLTVDAGTGAEKYLWQDGTTTSSLVVTQKGTYSVTLTNGNNCSITDNINIQEKCISVIYGPNAFTPNGDGVNDFFTFKGIKLNDFHLMIFNRWGEMLFESYDINKGWDGTYKGNDAQIDVYIWKIDVTPVKESESDFKYINVGSVALIR